jgi:hypothetical protein
MIKQYKNLEDYVNKIMKEWVTIGNYPKTLEQKYLFIERFNKRYYEKHKEHYIDFLQSKSKFFYTHYLDVFQRYVNYVEVKHT